MKDPCPLTFYVYGDSPEEFYILRLFWQMSDGDAYCCAVRFLIQGIQYAIKERQYFIMPFKGSMSGFSHGAIFEKMNDDGTFPPEVIERMESHGSHVPSIPEATLNYLFKLKADMDFNRLEDIQW